MPPSPPPGRRGYAAGLFFFGQGQRWVVRHPAGYARCLIPALITFALYTAALVLLTLWADDLAAWVTPFADDWDSGWRTALRVVVGIAFVGAGLLLAALTFTAVTLLIGDPFYDALSVRVEARYGPVPSGPDRPLWRELWISLVESLFMLWRALLFAVPLFLLGLVPFLGQLLAPVLGIAVAGFFLTTELASYALARRGIPVKARLRLMREHRKRALGFGIPLALLFLVPLAAVFLMPGAVAGATLLARDLHPAAPPSSPHPPGGAARQR
ncbi:EI24 domain-containing protein [Streptomyces sp. YIM 98790]|uniref:EI24 domain-containing protein n=1 Tax=Streptomyces sp. YIM 98790 TaxID=2689077 RepID=UPI0028BEE6AE|nr:EI24 domain-containing protein [Streptomyces sp. YIM 98790]